MAKDFWLWVCTTPNVSVFRIFDSRSGSGAKTLLGENYSGIVGTDRFCGYAWMDPSHVFLIDTKQKWATIIAENHNPLGWLDNERVIKIL